MGEAASSHAIALLSASTGQQTLVDTHPTNTPLSYPAHETAYNISLPRVDRKVFLHSCAVAVVGLSVVATLMIEVRMI